uniref:Photosystem I reaction center subunit III n=1 Tax=Cyanoptyche gloeocystis TaxID=77922 RepID=A0A3G1IWM9_9EUKA|nr:photosystem I subunit III [Cyanoptyche gloeocystis]|mmetsp:Transcript_15007/g.25683  ORF Transcript_15007/g.25683 Transcript_15007/m.25683 type:complete len:187 (-) Transcript_15007:162-722(-)
MKRFLLFTFTMCIFFALFARSKANADVAGLTPCSQSAEFNRRLNNSVDKLERRLKKYEPGSAPAEALQAQIKKTQSRFEKYSKEGLLCGADGLPHLIADGRWSHASEFTLPGLLFLYIAGFIGWSGRDYLQSIQKSDNPRQKEIVIDLGLALKSVSTAVLWPLAALKQFSEGTFVASSNEVPVSPR